MYRFGYIKYSSVDEAKAVYDQPQDIVLDGRTLFIDYYSEQTQGKFKHPREQTEKDKCF